MTQETEKNGFSNISKKMRSAGVAEIANTNFEVLYDQVAEGYNGCIAEAEIHSVHELPSINELNKQHARLGEDTRSKTVMLKLNGGLGTSMGLDTAKSLIKVKQQHSFLDIIAQHAIHSHVHLLLMNSFNTRKDSDAVLQNYPQLKKEGLLSDFVQHKVPKLDRDSLAPVAFENNEHLEWHPPGHGDIYIALVSSGALAELLDAGYLYAFISNADNLGAALDTKLLGHMVKENIPFLMEVTDRTEVDKKGGHLAHSADGRLILRESAQCPDENREDFENIKKHSYFNTNNLWIDLQKLQDKLTENNNILKLPLILNNKTLDPKDSNSKPVYQLETAMGAAISVFQGAQAIHVPRNRFAPVKTTEDLLLIRSDIFELNDNYTLSSQLPANALPMIKLDKRFYKLIDDFEARFPHGPPSLLKCENLIVEGDIVFAGKVTIEGKVQLQNNSEVQVSIPADSYIKEDMIWN